ncbi:MAG: hypothetical protein QNJ16_13095 [Rhodobacter sp.]|nr:hypothetical protein [Rhodobacter sp.]
MSFATERAMQEMYCGAIKEKTIRMLQHDVDWRRFRANSERAIARTAEENESYKTDYVLRVGKAREELLRKAGSLTHEHPTPVGTDRFDGDRINRLAQTKVRDDHERTLLAILNDEITGYEDIEESIRAREHFRGGPTKEFKRTTDRRSGRDRRMPER